ncbi:MAG: sulfotransferase domain-containing protein [bacterium]
MIIWIASYPRSGNTFLRTILNHCFNIKTYSIYNDYKGVGGDENTTQIVGHLFLDKDFDIEKARNSEEIFYIKTHEKYNIEMENDKAIYLIRDGREVLISYKNYLRNFPQKDLDFTDIIAGNTFVGIWSDHINSWNPNDRENILLLKYEELVDNTNKCIKEISSFLNIEPITFHVPDFEKLHNINPKFFRKGKKDSWKNILSYDEQKYFWFKSYEVMKKYGYINEIPELITKKENQDLISLTKIISKEITGLRNFEGDNYKNIQNKINSIIKQQQNTIQSQQNTIQSQQNTIQNQREKIQTKNQTIQNQKNKIERKNSKIQEQYDTIQEQKNKINSILNSRTYKLGRLLTVPYKFLKENYKKW